MDIITRQNKTGSASGLRDFDVLSLIEQMTIRCMNDVSEKYSSLRICLIC